MNIIAIGDIHGRDNWQEIVEKEDPDRFVFIGDYFDSREGIPAGEQLENFEKLIALKKERPAQVILLIGNHDYHYLDDAGQFSFSYQFSEAPKIKAMLQPAVEEGLLQMCYTHKKMVFTHAGITRTWAEANNIDMENLQESVNTLFERKPYAFKFNPGELQDSSGDETCQTPIWVRPNSLQKDGLEGWVQIVGHTIQYEITCVDDLYLIDTLGTSGQYLCWEANDFSIKTISAATSNR
ncbi:MAG: metallophosphoesterase [Owenweeksia sp.]|nr:metallophosphoesterase [Owenweeksia sp.]